MNDAPLPVVRLFRGRSRLRAFVLLLRRLHLYTGLLMLPWVLLYGVTAFLFNHPTFFSDQPTATFDASSLHGTPMSSPPVAAELAAQVVAALQARAKPEGRYTLVNPEQAKFTREFAFATVQADGREVSVLVEIDGSGGTVRSRPAPPAKVEAVAPFANGRPVGQRKGERASSPRTSDALNLENPLHERVKAAVPAILERTGFPNGEVAVTSVPDVRFLMELDGKLWRVTYNAQTGIVSGRSPDEVASEPISTRRFLTRLHLASGYPSVGNARWAWALAVDATAIIMVFWAITGIVMWWQIQSTRWLGLLVLLASAASATWVGIAMHDAISAAGR